MRENIVYYSGTYKSPIGDMNFLVTRDSKVVYLGFADETNGINRFFPDMVVSVKKDDGMGAELKKELNEYFAGERKNFAIKPSFSGTDFQVKVWNALLEIPYGKTESYSSIALRIGHPRADRAVGTAVGSNKVSIIVPCHRVIQASGRIGNYGGGVERKKYLLALEGGEILKA